MPPAGATIAIRPAGPPDAPALAWLHTASFPLSLTSRLGPVWVAVAYREVLTSPGHRLWLAAAGDEVVGFVHIRLPDARLRRSARRPIAAALWHLLRRDRPLRVALAALRLAAHQVGGRGAPSAPRGAATIVYLAVAGSYQGLGLGHRLLEAALRDHVPLAWVVTTERDNAAALALYRRHGFEPRDDWRGYDGRAYVRLHRPR